MITKNGVIFNVTSIVSILFLFNCGNSLLSDNEEDDVYFKPALNTEISISRSCWFQSGKPVPLNDSLSIPGKANWYNPVDREYFLNVWPEVWYAKLYGPIEGDKEVNVLVIKHSASGLSYPSYSGIMRALEIGDRDQSDAKYLELWAYCPAGTLRIDLGKISEDIIPNGMLDSEDRNNNRKLDSNEDTGIDGIPTGSPGDLDDDFHYILGTTDYSQINGTEGNNLDAVRKYYIDTEDINRNNVLDTINSYYSTYIVFQDSSSYIIPETMDHGFIHSETDYKLYRIPLWSVPGNLLTAIGNPQPNNIDFIRFTLMNNTGDMEISIAAVGFSNADTLDNAYYGLD